MSKNYTKIIKYTFLKVSLIPLSLLIISTLVFILLRVAPGDPVDAILGSGADDIAREALRTRLGLNESIISQYYNYIEKLIHFDLGKSLSNQEPVINIIRNSLPASLELGFVSIIIAILIGLPIGYWGLNNKNKSSDYISRIFGISTYAIPPFWGAMTVSYTHLTLPTTPYV